MRPKVSVIIPNYNAADYIEECVCSVLQQTYDNLEMIIVDDGSTDSSRTIINKLKNITTSIVTIYQENMNASIARNKGIDFASGDFYLFLDSDDILYPMAIEKMIEMHTSTGADLIIGNYKKISHCGEIVSECNVARARKSAVSPMELVGEVPNPSNKLYSAKIVRENNIFFGNVRIGQDLNFFLKYLLCCKKISFVDEYIYGWREIIGSISNSFNFRIFDITESFKDAKKFYDRQGADDLYNEYLLTVEYRHYYLQMEKQKMFSNRKARQIVVDYFSFLMGHMNIKKCKNYTQYLSDIKKCRMKMKLRYLYTSKLYFWLDKHFARK